MKVEFLSCPVQATLKTLGREWAFLVLTAIALFRANRFNDMLRAMPGLSKRLLTMRLAELERAKSYEEKAKPFMPTSFDFEAVAKSIAQSAGRRAPAQSDDRK